MLLPLDLPDDTPALLLLAGPGASALQVTCKLDADQVRGLTIREERRALAPWFTVRMRWTATMPEEGAHAFRAGLLALGRTEAGVDGVAAPMQPVLCPFWPAARLVTEPDPGHFSAALWAVWEPDGTRGAVFTGAIPLEYDVTDESLIAPILAGRFEDWPEPDAITDRAARATLTWTETGTVAQAMQVSADAAPAGPSLHGEEWPVLPCAVRHREASAGGVSLSIGRKKLGFGRAEAESFYPQVPARALEIGQDLTMSEAAALLAHWHERAGVVSPFWAPAATSPCRLAVAAAADATTITVDDADALLGHAHVWLASPSGEATARRITGIAGDVLTLDGAVGFAAATAWTLVQPLLFVRFARNELTLEWDGATWSATAPLVELPAEYGVAAGEDHGVNHGPLAPPAWCYTITDGVQTWRLTSYAAALTLGGEIFAAHTIVHGELKERVNLDASDATVNLRDWPGSPFARYRLERAPTPLSLTIHEGRPEAGVLEDAAAIWTGRVRSAKWSGPMLTLSVGGFGTMLDQPVPRWLLQPTCSTDLFNPKACALDRAQWTFTATRAHPQGSTYVHDLTGLSWRSGAALPTVGAQYFAGGYVVRTRAGQASQMIGITSSTARVGGALSITLSAALNPAPAADETWSLLPGCDGRLVTCRTKFNNLAKFRGFASIPTTNPSIEIRRKNSAGGKK